VSPALSNNNITLANELVTVIKKAVTKQHDSFLLLWYNILLFNQNRQDLNFYCNSTEIKKNTMLL